nr:hypothetical protein B0A51_16476 [Rachicladosporium sp. CCFEE 5018]
MGLPMWTDPDEKVNKPAAIKTDPTAAARSSIRRRPSIHGPRGGSRRDTRALAPRLERSPPPALGGRTSRPLGPGASRFTRRNGRAGVPPISILLESADRERRYRDPPIVARAYRQRENETQALDSSLARLREQTERLSRRAGNLAASLRAQGELYDEEATERELARIDARIQASSDRIRQLSERHRRPPGTWDFHMLTRPDVAAGEEATAPARATVSTPPVEPVLLQAPGQPDILYYPDPVLAAPPRSHHPLSRSWQPSSPVPVDGLGDRNRSPTPAADTWDLMRSTIAPDTTLPSASSSFTSAAASASFGAGGSTQSSHPSASSSPASSAIDPMDDLEGEADSDSCGSFSMDEEDEEVSLLAHSATFASHLYNMESETRAGQARISYHRRLQSEQGTRFTIGHEGHSVDIGFRLIEEALRTESGRERLSLIGSAEPGHAELAAERALRLRTERAADLAVDALSASGRTYVDTRPAIAPPRRTREAALAEEDERARSIVEQTEVLSDETDLNAMRRVVERLAQRDDVPEEWWVSMGLNFAGRGSGSEGRRERIEERVGEAARL